MRTPPNPPELMTEATSVLRDPQHWGPMLDLPCDLTFELIIPKFTVSELLRLGKGSVLDSQWAQGDDIPVRVNGELVALGEFEAIDGRLGLRITEWA